MAESAEKAVDRAIQLMEDVASVMTAEDDCAARGRALKQWREDNQERLAAVRDGLRAHSREELGPLIGARMQKNDAAVRAAQIAHECETNEEFLTAWKAIYNIFE